MNHIFIYGHVRIERDSLPCPFEHVFGATATLENERITTKSGIDFGASYGYDTSGLIGQKKVSDAIIIPISDQSFWSFGNMVENLSALDIEEESPFYFSHYSTASSFMEGDQEKFFDLNGALINKANFVFDNSAPIRSNGIKMTADSGFLIDRSFDYVRANCIEMLNFVAGRSGIDLQQINKNWWSLGSEDELCETLASSFNTGRFKIKQCPNMVFETCETPSGATAWKISNDDSALVPVNDLTRAMAQAKGGCLKMFNFFQTLKPLECDPHPIPRYLQDRLDTLDLRDTYVPS